MSLGAAIDVLVATITARANAPADQSYTATLLAAGPTRCAQKLGEEAVEAAIAAAQGNAEELTKEAADLLFHLLVLLKAGGVSANAVAAELTRRTGQSGLAEMAGR
jgi:phosphoribosyl-ATP pyrophosphohydrolase